MFLVLNHPVCGKELLQPWETNTIISQLKISALVISLAWNAYPNSPPTKMIVNILQHIQHKRHGSKTFHILNSLTLLLAL